MRILSQACVLIFLLAAFFSCLPAEERLEAPAAPLRFSADTVKFDTVFTDLALPTRRLTVYNPGAHALQLDLSLPQGSPYRYWANGRPGPQVQGLLLRGGDSLLLVVELRVPPRDQDAPFPVQSQLRLQPHGGEAQQLLLHAYGQDVYRHRLERLSGEQRWEARRPHLVIDSVEVLAGGRLLLEAGTQVRFAPGAALRVAGLLEAEGTQADSVLLRGLGQGKDYAEAPGQWAGVRMLPGGELKGRHLHLLHAQCGIGGKQAKVGLSASRVQYSSLWGIDLQDSWVEMSNTCLSAGEQGLLRLQQGSGSIRHCTLANYTRGIRQQPSVLLQQAQGLRFTHNLVWGGYMQEFWAQGDVTIASNLLRTAQTDWAQGNLLNQDPRFLRAGRDFPLRRDSPAIDAAPLLSDLLSDIWGKERTGKADLGAWEF